MNDVIDGSLKRCPNCNGLIEPDSRFCSDCAFDLTGSRALTELDSVNTQGLESNIVARDIRTRNSNRIPALLTGALVILLTLGAAVFVLYKRNRAQVSQMAATTSTVPTMSDRAKQIEERILRGDALQNSDIANLSAYELRVLRNVHFARYGRKYEQPGLGDYFTTRPWYQPNENYSDSMLTATDKANVNLFVSIEKQQASSTLVSNDSSSNSTSNSQINATTTSSDSLADSWQTFWRQFSAAVNNKDRIALKALMSSENDFFSGGGGENRDQWIQMIDQRNAWRYLQKSVASGPVPFKSEKGPSHITKDKNLIFTLIDGRWRFVGVMGD
jgi:hypothetical protein